MSETTDAVAAVTQPIPRQRWFADTTTLTLRVFILACGVAGITTTLAGLQDAFSSGVALRFGQLSYRIWGVLPYLLLVGMAARPVSRRSLATLLVTMLLAWFMSTGYSNLEQMELGIGIIPLIQLAFVAGAMMVLLTFWALRRDGR